MKILELGLQRQRWRRSGRAGCSSREAVEAALERLHSVNPAIDAVVEILGDEALAAAEQADSRLLRGTQRPVHFTACR